MQFEHPIIFSLLLLVPLLLLGAILAARSRSEGWKKLIGARLRGALVREGATVRRWTSYGLGLLALALLIATLTIPHAGHRKEAEVVRGRNILLALDVSRSMLAKDESPITGSTHGIKFSTNPPTKASPRIAAKLRSLLSSSSTSRSSTLANVSPAGAAAIAPVISRETWFWESSVEAGMFSRSCTTAS